MNPRWVSLATLFLLARLAHPDSIEHGTFQRPIQGGSGWDAVERWIKDKNITVEKRTTDRANSYIGNINGWVSRYEAAAIFFKYFTVSGNEDYKKLAEKTAVEEEKRHRSDGAVVKLSSGYPVPSWEVSIRFRARMSNSHRIPPLTDKAKARIDEIRSEYERKCDLFGGRLTSDLPLQFDFKGRFSHPTPWNRYMDWWDIIINLQCRRA